MECAKEIRSCIRAVKRNKIGSADNVVTVVTRERKRDSYESLHTWGDIAPRAARADALLRNILSASDRRFFLLSFL